MTGVWYGGVTGVVWYVVSLVGRAMVTVASIMGCDMVSLVKWGMVTVVIPVVRGMVAMVMCGVTGVVW